MNNKNNNAAQEFDMVKAYLKDINEYKLLTRDEEKELLARKNLGSKDALNQLTSHNLRLVVSIAKSYYKSNSSFTLMDLIQVGNLGLIEGIKRFDVSTGNALSTYVVWWIKQSIREEIGERSSIVRVPVYAKNIYNQVISLVNQEGYTLEEACEISGTTLDKFFTTMRALDTSSLDSPCGEDEESSLIDFIVDEDKAYNEVLDNQISDSVFKAMKKCLNEKEIFILTCRFGLGERLAMTLEEIGELLDLTRERIRQIQKEAEKKMRFELEKRHQMCAKEVCLV